MGFDYDLTNRPFGRALLRDFSPVRYRPGPTPLGAVGRTSWPLLWVLGLPLLGYRRLGR